MSTKEKQSPWLRKKPVQNHHLSYSPEVTVKIFKDEHWVLVQLGRRKYISKGFIRSLKQYVLDREDQAIDLETPEAVGEVRG